MPTILHICESSAWTEAKRRGEYRAASLAAEGFIHGSTPEQVIGTANRHFHGQSNLIVLVIETDNLTAPIRFEGIAGGALFPHVYGPIDLHAVFGVRELYPSADGTFAEPPDGWVKPWNGLRPGDRVRIARIPTGARRPGVLFPAETLLVFQQLAAVAAELTIEEIDEYGNPWTESFDFDETGGIVKSGIGHRLALSDDSWERV